VRQGQVDAEPDTFHDEEIVHLVEQISIVAEVEGGPSINGRPYGDSVTVRAQPLAVLRVHPVNIT
jgi:hypothetical protein